MNKNAKLALLLSATALISSWMTMPAAQDAEDSPRNTAMKEDSSGSFREERDICGESRITPELHNVTYTSSDSACHKVGDGKWCFKATQLNIVSPNSKWVFVGQPRIECVRDNQGSCGWNQLGKPDRFWTSLFNPTEVRATALTNSRSIQVRICALARHYP